LKKYFPFFNVKKDLVIFYNTLIPLLIGVIIYNLNGIIDTKLINYLPDALWAYSLTIFILWIWEWQINIFNTTLVFSTELLFEMLQKSKFISGTFDKFDILTYFISSLIGLLIIRIFNFAKNQ
jgi:hypothetical protein